MCQFMVIYTQVGQSHFCSSTVLTLGVGVALLVDVPYVRTEHVLDGAPWKFHEP